MLQTSDRFFGASTSSGERFFVQVNVRSRLMETTFDMIVEMITGSRCCVGEGKRFVHMAEEAFRLSSIPNPADFMPFLRWVGVNGLQKRLQRLEKEIDGLIEEIVDEIRRRRTKKEGQCTESGDADMTLVAVMLSMQEENPQVYTYNITQGMVEVLLLAGTDTTAVSMEWAMTLFLNHPEALQKVHDEIETHVGHQRLVADSDISNLRYLNNVIKETLRLFPPGPPLVPRESTMECKVGGLHVPRGTMLLVNAHMVHRDPEVWANPTRFMPERFETEEGEGYKFIPFGAGRRRCPGQALAEKTMGLALASLVQCFEWRRVGEEEVDLSESEGLTAPMAVPLEALCMPRQAMREVLSQL